RAARRSDATRNRGFAADRGWRHGQGGGAQTRYRPQDRRQPHPEPLFENRRHDPGRSGTFRPRTGSPGIGNPPHAPAKARRHPPSVIWAIRPRHVWEKAVREQAIKVGVIADQTGPLSFVGIANANVAQMVINDINARGGLLGRQIDLYLEDSATIDSVAEAKATKLVQHDNVDVIIGGIYSSTRQAIKGPAVVKGRKLYIYPEQYEGQECDPLIFCTGPVPAQQVDPLIPWLMRETGAKKFYLPSADYIWPHTMNKKVREVVTANGGSIVGEEDFPLDHADYRETVRKIEASGAEVVFNTTVPPGVAPFLEQLYDSGFTGRGGKLVCTYFDENFLNMVPAEHVEGLYSCLDYYQAVSDPFSA